MDRTTYLLRELSAWQRRVGRNAEQTRQEAGQVNERLGDEAARNDETDAALGLKTAQVQAIADRADFIEDCIAEMAMQVYSGV